MSLTIDIAQSFLFDAWNETDLADRLVQGARARLAEGNIDDALSDLRLALRPAEASASRISWAIEYLEKLKAVSP